MKWKLSGGESDLSGIKLKMRGSGDTTYLT